MRRMVPFAISTLLSAAISAGAAAISGTVRAAASGGGDATPVEGATVVLIGITGGGGGGAQVRLDSVTTDAEGKYAFAQADTGTRLLNAIKEGYRTGTGFVNVASDTGSYTVNITLQPPPDTTPGALTGTVREGNSQGTPVAGATVVLSRSFGGAGGAGDTATTDEKGRYAFASVAPATYGVRVTADGYQAATANATVRARDTTVADVALLPEGASGSLAGTITRVSDGSAVSGAQVILTRGGGGGGGGGAFTPDTATTDAKGAYAFDSVPVAQNYTVTVHAEGLQSAVSGGWPVAYGEKRTVDIALVAAAADDTTHGSVAGMVTDAEHKAVSGARVILSRSAGGGGATASADTLETDDDGRFLFAEVTAQNGYRLTVSGSGFRTATVQNVTVAVARTTIENVSLQAASSIRAPARALPQARLSSAGPDRLRLEMPASTLPGRVRIFDARGTLGFSGTLAAGATRLDIPWASGRAGYALIQRGGVVRRLATATAAAR